MKIDIRKVYTTVLIFCFIYVPPFFPHAFVLWWCFFFILLIFKFRTVEKIVNKKAIIIMMLATLIALWSFVRTSFFVDLSSSIRLLSSEIALLLFAPVGVFAILATIIDGHFDRPSIWKMIIYAGVLQSVISLLAYVFYPFQTFMCHFLQNIMSIETISWWRNYRLYGLATSLPYGMPIAQALIGGLCFLYAKKYDSRFGWFVPFIWLSGFLNARVSVIVVLIEIILWIANGLWNMKGKIKRFTIVSIFICSVVLFAIIYLVCVGKIIISRRITDPIVELITLINGELQPQTHGYFQYFIYNSSSLDIPVGSQLIFGGGLNNDRSDVGYIIHLWVGGITFSVALYSFYIFLMNVWARILPNDKHMRLMVLAFGLSLFVSNIKGEAFIFLGEFKNLFFLGMGVSHIINDSFNKCLLERELCKN